jgi:hypothetical protein
MRRFFVLIILTMAVCFFPLNAAIAGDISFNRHTGPYVEANAGYTFAWLTGGFFGNDFSQGAGVGFGWNVGGGYMFKDWLGAEVGYLQFNPDVHKDSQDYNISVGGAYLAARFNIPIKDRYSFIIKVGAMTLSASDSDHSAEDAVTSGAMFTGIGVGYALTDKIDLSLQFQGPNLIIVGAGVLSGGLTYHF